MADDSAASSKVASEAAQSPLTGDGGRDLERELDEARAEIRRLRDELATARQRTDILQSIHEFRRAAFERLGWFSLEDVSKQLPSRFSYELPSPKKRQAFAVSLMFLLWPASILMTASLTWCCIFKERSGVLAAALFVYFAHIALDTRPERGSIPNSWVKGHPFWRAVTDYFPLELRKMNADTVFPSDVVYLFGYHPHGLLGVGCFLNFMTTATGFQSLFPGINLRGGTLEFNFRIPFFRELLLRLGAIPVSARSIRHVLRLGPGYGVVIVPGGAAEALDARPGAHDLVLQKRNGFFRIALQHGAHLVPVYSFGENELYEHVPNRPGSFLRSSQEFLLRVAGYTLPCFIGAGSQPWPGSGNGIPFNPVPRRHPVITVVGDPIPCEMVESPTQQQIDELKALYIDQLKAIFDRFADEYAPSRERGLRIVK